MSIYTMFKIFIVFAFNVYPGSLNKHNIYLSIYLTSPGKNGDYSAIKAMFIARMDLNSQQ